LESLFKNIIKNDRNNLFNQLTYSYSSKIIAMKSLLIKTGMLILLISLPVLFAHGQGSLLRKIQEKTEQKVVNEIFKEPKGNQENQNYDDNNNNNSNNRSGSANPQNRRGTGLSTTAPDVVASIRQADDAYKASSYLQAKNAVKNALWGVELEIGKKVLESLPATVAGLPVNTPGDRVSSSGMGFAGLIIERVYEGNNDMQLKATIGNDSGLLGLAGFYMVDGGYMQSTEQANQKSIQFKDHRAVVKYDEDDGYTLSVPFGQSSVFMINGVNFDDETQFMAAANTFDLAKIKKDLGEQ
jgi:hypothetical protein